MHLIRLIAVVLALVGAIIIGEVTGMELRDVMLCLAFIIAVDTLTVRTVANIYLKHMLKQSERKDGK